MFESPERKNVIHLLLEAYFDLKEYTTYGYSSRSILDALGESPDHDGCLVWEIASESQSGGMADALDSKSCVLNGRVGSTPTFGTLIILSNPVWLQSIYADN